MADYYTLASFIIPTKTDEQQLWIVGVLEGLSKFHAGDGDPSDCLPHEVVKKAEEAGFDFECANLPDWDVREGGVWVHSENVDVELLTVIVQPYLEKFHPNSYFGFEWSDSCSKDRLDAFGGGAVYMSAKELEVHHTKDWLEDTFKEASEGGGELLR